MFHRNYEPILVELNNYYNKPIVTIDLSPAFSIREMKQIIEKRYQFPISCEALIYNGKILSDDKTLQDCEIVIDSNKLTFVIKAEPIQIFLNAPSGKKINVNCHPTSTFKNLKEYICDKDDSCFFIDDLLFHCSNKNLPMHSEILDGLSLHEYEISNGSTLDIIFQLKGG